MEKNTKAKRSTFTVLFYLNTSKRKKTALVRLSDA